MIAKTTIAFAAVLMTAAPVAAEPFAERVQALRANAFANLEAGDVEGAVRELEADLALQPGHAGLLGRLGLWEAARGDLEAAAARVAAVADTGGTLNVDALREELGANADAPAFAGVFERLAANAEPVGAAETVAVVDDPDLLVEGVAVASDGAVFVTTIVGRAILRRAPGAETFEVFADRDDGLFSVSGIGLDETNGLLWVATRGFGQTPLDDGEEAATALVAFDLATGEVRARLAPNDEEDAELNPPGLADLTVAPDGTVYVSDPENARVMRAAGVAGPLEVFVASDALMSPQGLAVVGDRLYVADYGRGLFVADRAAGALRAVAAPDDASLIGMDGLAAAPDGSLVAVQNGFRPNRVVRIHLDDSGARIASVDVLAAALPEFDEPTLGQVVDGRFVFVAESQWPSFPEAGAEVEEASVRHATRILAVDLDE